MKKAAVSVGEKSVELIPVKDITRVTGYFRGGCTPIGMKKQFSTVIHRSAAEFDRIMISGGRIGSQIELNPNDLIGMCNGVFADIIMAGTKNLKSRGVYFNGLFITTNKSR